MKQTIYTTKHLHYFCHLARIITIATLFSIATTFSIACNDDPAPPSSDKPADDPTLLRAASKGGHFIVEARLPESPTPFQKLFSLEVSVFDAENNTLLTDDITLELRAEVQTFGNRMTTTPKISANKAGKITIDGLLFHVPLPWELAFDIKHNDRRDRASLITQPVGQFTGELPEQALTQFTAEELRQIFALSSADPIPDDPTNKYASDVRAQTFGQELFFDARFSADGTISCATCHAADHGFSDPNRLSQGIGTTDRRSMPVLNAGYHRWYFWDGRADSLWAQALQPLENPVEHGTNRTRIAHEIFADSSLRATYEDIFGPMPSLEDAQRFPANARPVDDDAQHPDNLSWQTMSATDQDAVNRVFVNFAKAVAAYEMKIATNNAPFDTFVEGLRTSNTKQQQAISQTAIDGLKIFVGKGNCVHCHSGPQMSNSEFHNLGIDTREWLPDEDQGRAPAIEQVLNNPFNAAGPYSDAPHSSKARLLEHLAPESFDTAGAFRTPGLRNVATRAPYMHGAHMATLQDVMVFYGDLQEDSTVGMRDPLVQPINLSPTEIDALVAFMNALTSKPLPDSLISAPR